MISHMYLLPKHARDANKPPEYKFLREIIAKEEGNIQQLDMSQQFGPVREITTRILVSCQIVCSLSQIFKISRLIHFKLYSTEYINL